MFNSEDEVIDAEIISDEEAKQDRKIKRLCNIKRQLRKEWPLIIFVVLAVVDFRFVAIPLLSFLFYKWGNPPSGGKVYNFLLIIYFVVVGCGCSRVHSVFKFMYAVMGVYAIWRLNKQYTLEERKIESDVEEFIKQQEAIRSRHKQKCR